MPWRPSSTLLLFVVVHLLAFASSLDVKYENVAVTLATGAFGTIRLINPIGDVVIAGVNADRIVLEAVDDRVTSIRLLNCGVNEVVDLQVDIAVSVTIDSLLGTPAVLFGNISSGTTLISGSGAALVSVSMVRDTGRIVLRDAVIVTTAAENASAFSVGAVADTGRVTIEQSTVTLRVADPCTRAQYAAIAVGFVGPTAQVVLRGSTVVTDVTTQCAQTSRRAVAHGMSLSEVYNASTSLALDGVAFDVKSHRYASIFFLDTLFHGASAAQFEGADNTYNISGSDVAFLRGPSATSRDSVLAFTRDPWVATPSIGTSFARATIVLLQSLASCNLSFTGNFSASLAYVTGGSVEDTMIDVTDANATCTFAAGTFSGTVCVMFDGNVRRSQLGISNSLIVLDRRTAQPQPPCEVAYLQGVVVGALLNGSALRVDSSVIAVHAASECATRGLNHEAVALVVRRVEANLIVAGSTLNVTAPLTATAVAAEFVRGPLQSDVFHRSSGNVFVTVSSAGEALLLRVSSSLVEASLAWRHHTDEWPAWSHSAAALLLRGTHVANCAIAFSGDGTLTTPAATIRFTDFSTVSGSNVSVVDLYADVASNAAGDEPFRIGVFQASTFIVSRSTVRVSTSQTCGGGVAVLWAAQVDPDSQLNVSSSSLTAAAPVAPCGTGQDTTAAVLVVQNSLHFGQGHRATRVDASVLSATSSGVAAVFNAQGGVSGSFSASAASGAMSAASANSGASVLRMGAASDFSFRVDAASVVKYVAAAPNGLAALIRNTGACDSCDIVVRDVTLDMAVYLSEANFRASNITMVGCTVAASTPGDAMLFQFGDVAGASHVAIELSAATAASRNPCGATLALVWILRDVSSDSRLTLRNSSVALRGEVSSCPLQASRGAAAVVVGGSVHSFAALDDWTGVAVATNVSQAGLVHVGGLCSGALWSSNGAWSTLRYLSDAAAREGCGSLLHCGSTVNTAMHLRGMPQQFQSSPCMHVLRVAGDVTASNIAMERMQLPHAAMHCGDLIDSNVLVQDASFDVEYRGAGAVVQLGHLGGRSTVRLQDVALNISAGPEPCGLRQAALAIRGIGPAVAVLLRHLALNVTAVARDGCNASTSHHGIDFGDVADASSIRVAGSCRISVLAPGNASAYLFGSVARGLLSRALFDSTALRVVQRGWTAVSVTVCIARVARRPPGTNPAPWAIAVESPLLIHIEADATLPVLLVLGEAHHVALTLANLALRATPCALLRIDGDTVAANVLVHDVLLAEVRVNASHGHGLHGVVVAHGNVRSSSLYVGSIAAAIGSAESATAVACSHGLSLAFVAVGGDCVNSSISLTDAVVAVYRRQRCGNASVSLLSAGHLVQSRIVVATTNASLANAVGGTAAISLRDTKGSSIALHRVIVVAAGEQVAGVAVDAASNTSRFVAVSVRFLAAGPDPLSSLHVARVAMGPLVMADCATAAVSTADVPPVAPIVDDPTSDVRSRISAIDIEAHDFGNVRVGDRALLWRAPENATALAHVRCNRANGAVLLEADYATPLLQLEACGADCSVDIDCNASSADGVDGTSPDCACQCSAVPWSVNWRCDPTVSYVTPTRELEPPVSVTVTPSRSYSRTATPNAQRGSTPQDSKSPVAVVPGAPDGTPAGPTHETTSSDVPLEQRLSATPALSDAPYSTPAAGAGPSGPPLAFVSVSLSRTVHVDSERVAAAGVQRLQAVIADATSPGVARTVVTAAATSVLLAAATSPTAGSKLSNLANLASAAQCSLTGDDLTPAAWQVGVVWSLGSSRFASVNGPIVSMLLFLAACHVLNAVLYAAMPQHTKVRIVGGALGALATAWFAPAIVSMASLVVFHGPSFDAGVFGVLGTVGVCVVLIAPAVLIHRAVPGAVLVNQRGKLRWPGAESRVLALHTVYCAARDPATAVSLLHFYEDAAVSAVMSIIGAVRPGGSGCVVVAVALCAVAVAHLLYAVFARPLRTRIDTVASIGVALLQTAIAFLVVAAAMSGGSLRLAAYVAILLTVGFLAHAVALTVRLLWRIAKQGRASRIRDCDWRPLVATVAPQPCSDVLDAPLLQVPVSRDNLHGLELTAAEALMLRSASAPATVWSVSPRLVAPPAKPAPTRLKKRVPASEECAASSESSCASTSEDEASSAQSSAASLRCVRGAADGQHPTVKLILDRRAAALRDAENPLLTGYASATRAPAVSPKTPPPDGAALSAGEETQRKQHTIVNIKSTPLGSVAAATIAARRRIKLQRRSKR